MKRATWGSLVVVLLVVVVVLAIWHGWSTGKASPTVQWQKTQSDIPLAGERPVVGVFGMEWG